MKKTLHFLHENPRLLRPIAIGLFSSLFIVSSILGVLLINGTFEIRIAFLFLAIAGFLTREYITSLFDPLKNIFPTSHMTEKTKKLLDKLFNWTIALCLLGLGINPVSIFLQTGSIRFQLNYNILAISFCFLIIYIIGVMVGSAYFFYKEDYKKFMGPKN